MPIFMSYSRDDESVVKTLRLVLAAAGRELWFDHDIAGGALWWDTILDNIRSCSVFLFAASDNSLRSTACRYELKYALALNRQIVPIEVGTITTLPASPLAPLNVIPFDARDAVGVGTILGAVLDAERRQEPLPDPLPAEPPIPYAYLQGLGDRIDNLELDEKAQFSVIDQLGKALDDETDDSVRRTIAVMLRTLRKQPSTTNRIRRRIRLLLLTHEFPVDLADEDDPIPDPGPSDDPEQDAKAIFLAHMEKLRQQRVARQADQPTVRLEPDGPDDTADAPLFPGVSLNAPTGPVHPVDAESDQPLPFTGVRTASSTASEEISVASDTTSTSDPPFFPGIQQPPVDSVVAQSNADVDADEKASTPPDPPPSPVRSWAAAGIVALILSVACAALLAAVSRGSMAVIFTIPVVIAVIALVFSAQVAKRSNAGNRAGAGQASRTALAFGVVAVVVCGVALLVILNTSPTA
jgi:hypothetical protein